MIDEKDLPIVLIHGTMGKSEDWSPVVKELSNSRAVIRPNYIEGVAGRKSTNELAVKDLADEVVTAVRAEGLQRFDLVGGSLGAQLPHASRQSIRRWFVRLSSYQVSAMAAIPE